MFLLFVDFKKAYDFVPHSALWCALRKLGMPDLLIDIIRSFHEGMKAKVQINGKLLEEIDVENGLRHGCAMAPVLFNLYAGLVFEQWTPRAAGLEGVGIILLHRFDQKLFRKSTRNACESQLIDDQFADDAVLLATTRAGAEQAMRLYCDVAKAFGLTVSIQKIKLMVTGFNTKEEEKAPTCMCAGDSLIEYFGSVVTPNAKMDAEVDRHIASASKAFSTLSKAVFKDRNLNITTKRHVYQACVLSLLLYRSECWMPLCRHLKCLPSSVHPHSSGHHEQEAMGATHHLPYDKRSVGRCRDSVDTVEGGS